MDGVEKGDVKNAAVLPGVTGMTVSFSGIGALVTNFASISRRPESPVLATRSAHYGSLRTLAKSVSRCGSDLEWMSDQAIGLAFWCHLVRNSTGYIPMRRPTRWACAYRPISRVFAKLRSQQASFQPHCGWCSSLIIRSTPGSPSP